MGQAEVKLPSAEAPYGPIAQPRDNQLFIKVLFQNGTPKYCLGLH